MIRQIPEELIALHGDRYIELLAGIGALEAAVQAWQAGNRFFLSRIEGFGNLHVVTLIRRALAQCPDQAATPATARLTFITEDDLRKSIQLDISSAHQDLSEGEWKGATVLAGSAVEALLLWALQEHEESTPGSVRVAVVTLLGGKPLSRDPGGDLEGPGWHLHEYVEVAACLNIIRSDTATLVRLAKDFRNLIHPGRAARLEQKCDRATALGALAAVEAVARDLTP